MEAIGKQLIIELAVAVGAAAVAVVVVVEVVDSIGKFACVGECMSTEIDARQVMCNSFYSVQLFQLLNTH
jgi:hypothetical protein